MRRRTPHNSRPPTFRSGRLGAIFAVALVATGCVRYEPRPIALATSGAALEQRRLDAPELRDFLTAAAGRAPAIWPIPTWDLNALTLAAMHFHPDLAVAQAGAHLGAAGQRTAAGRPNPTIGLQGGYNFDAARSLASGSGVSPWIPGITLDVPIETAGKRRLRQARAGQLAEGARLEVLVVAWQIRARLHAAWIDVSATAGRQELLRDQAKLQQSLVTLLTERLAAGAISLIELSSARLALLKLESEQADTARALVEARGRLAEAVGLPVAALATAHFDFSRTTRAQPVQGERATLRLQALQSRAEILAALALYEASQSALQVEIAKQYPDLHLGNGYQWDQGESKWSFGVGLELPVLNRNQGPIAEAEAQRQQAAAKVLAAQARALGEIDRAWDLLDALGDAQQRADAWQRQLQEQVRLTEARLNAGGADVVEVESSRLELAVSALASLDLATRTAQAEAQLEAALQRPIAALFLLPPVKSKP